LGSVDVAGDSREDRKVAALHREAASDPNLIEKLRA